MSTAADGSGRYDTEADAVAEVPKEPGAQRPADYIVGSFLVAVVILALLGYI